MSQPHNRACTAPQPGELDEELDEFWVTDPWSINLSHNLSSFERNRLFLNVNGEHFVETGYLSNTDSDGDGRSVVPVDFDRDGMRDLFVRQVGGGALKLYKNQLPKKNYLRVSLRGVESNRLGIGARLVAKVGNKQLVRELFPHNSFRSQAPNEVHFGVGQAARIDTLTISWPSGTIETLENIPANQWIEIEEGSASFEPYPSK